MPTTGTIPNPEDHLGSDPIGLDLDGLRFTMPKIGKQEITSTISFSFESLLTVMELYVKSADTETVVSTVVSFVRANSSIPGYVVSVAVSELFDMALADMLDTVGDVDMKSAIRALNDAQQEQAKDGKHRYRMIAENSLRNAYEKFEAAISARERKWANRKLGYGDSQKLSEHGKCAIAASTIAIILHAEALRSGVCMWSDNARDHFGAYGAMIEKEHKEYADKYDSYKSDYYATRLTAGKRVADAAAIALGMLIVKRLVPPPNHTAAQRAEADFQRATKAVEIMGDLSQSRVRFDALYKQLQHDDDEDSAAGVCVPTD